MKNNKCLLAEDLNHCSYFNANGYFCNRPMPHGCGMLERDNEPGFTRNGKYVRKERWYEKYYKTSKPIRN